MNSAFKLLIASAFIVPSLAKTCPKTCPDPVGTEHYLDFDYVGCPSVCPVPLSYDHFTFDGASGWLFLNATSSTYSPDPRVATTLTGTLATNSSGWVDFGTFGPGWWDPMEFDLMSFYFSTWTNDGVEGHPSNFFIKGTKTNGAQVQYNTTLNTGFAVGPNMIDFTTFSTTLAQWSGLRNVAFQAFTNYNPATQTGRPATIIFDQFRYKRHADPCALAASKA
ncbi:hypothetical protein BKA62DRAFT_715418 [Auriculariales sp. MPI-PUGE-AT-0066]|nr:hypothetical protein BKA62DRAFT_715418 [Auriculariales sp. MPI-PUGE-AT-0066]